MWVNLRWATLAQNVYAAMFSVCADLKMFLNYAKYNLIKFTLGIFSWGGILSGRILSWNQKSFTHFACRRQKFPQPKLEKQIEPQLSAPEKWNCRIWWSFASCRIWWSFTETVVSWKVLRGNKHIWSFSYAKILSAAGEVKGKGNLLNPSHIKGGRLRQSPQVFPLYLFLDKSYKK